MNTGGNDVSVKFGGTTTDLDNASNKAVKDIEKVGNAAGGVSGRFGKLGQSMASALNGVKGHFGQINTGTSKLGSAMSEAAAKTEASGSKMRVALGGAQMAMSKVVGVAEGGGIQAAASGLEGVAMAGGRVAAMAGPIGLAVAAVLALAAASAMAIKVMMDFGERMADDAEKLDQYSQKLGMTAEAVSGWGAIFQAAGSSTAAFASSTTRLERAMVQAASGGKRQSAAFKELGIDLKQVKDPAEVLLKTADKFKEMENGPKKTALAMQLMGRTGANMIPVLNMGRKAIEDQIATAKEYGAVVDDAFVQKGLRVDDAMDQMAMGMQGIRNVMFNSLAPAIAATAEWLNTLIKAMVRSYQQGGFMKGVVESLAIAFKLLVTPLVIVIGVLKAMYHTAASAAYALGALGQAVSGNFEGANKTMKESARHAKAIVGSAKEAGNVLGKVWGGGGAPDATARPDAKEFGDLDDGSGGGKKGGAGQSAMQKWQQEWDRRQMAEKQYLRDSTADEVAFWETKVSLTKAGSQERFDVEKKVYELRKSLAQKEVQDFLDDNNYKMELARDNYEVQAKLEDDKLSKLEQSYGKDSSEYKRALQDKERNFKAHLKEQEQAIQDNINATVRLMETVHARDNDLRSIERAEKQAHFDTLDQMGAISGRKRIDAMRQFQQEEMNQQIGYETALYQLREESILDQLKLDQLTPVERRRLNAEMLQLQEDFEARLMLLRRRGAAEQKRINDVAATQTQQKWMNMLNPIAGAFDGFLQAMWTKSKTFIGGLLDMVNQVVGSFISMGVQMLARWVATQIGMTAAHTAQTAVRTGADTAAATTGVAVNIAKNVAEVMSLAAVSGAAAFAATAAIPIVGPAMAPGAAAAAYGATAAFAPLAVAAKGYDIPAGTNPLVQAHEQEMILPANIAVPLRAMLKGAGPRKSDLGATTAARMGSPGSSGASGGPGGMGGDSHHWHIAAVDARGVKKWFEDNHRNIAAAARKAARANVSGR